MPLQDYEHYKKERAEAALDLPMRGVVNSVQPEKETVNVSAAGTGGAPSFAIRHPYMGVTSWIRVCPEEGTPVLIQARGDKAQQEIWGYVSNKLAQFAKMAKEKHFPYRLLRQGEIELTSAGKASLFLSSKGDVELFGGALLQGISQSELEHYACAPTYSRRLAKHNPTTLAHEERFGLVKRPDKLNPEFRQVYVKNPDLTFACEYSHFLSDTNDILLASSQEGHVVDAMGKFVKQTSTNKNLRYDRIWADTSNQATLTIQLDENLNLSIVNSDALATETKIDFGPQNEVTLKSKKFAVQVTETGNLQFSNSLVVTAGKIQFSSTNVQFGSAATEPVMLGNRFTNSIMMPLLSVLLAFFTAFSADPVAAITLPASKGYATPPVAIITQALAQLAQTLSTQVKLTA